MQENEFENTIRKKMETLQLVPKDEVWNNVSANIYKEKRRKRFLIFLFTCTLLAGLVGLYVYFNPGKTVSFLADENNNAHKENLLNNRENDFIEKKSDTPVAAIADDKKAIVTNKSGEITNNQNHTSNHQKLVDNKKSIVINRALKSSFTNTLSNKIESYNDAQTVNEASDINGSNKEKQHNTLQESAVDKDKALQESLVPETDSTYANASNTTIAKAANDTIKTLAAAEDKLVKKVKHTVSKKWNIGFAAFTGLSNNVSGLSLLAPFGTAYSSSYASSLPGQSNGGVGNASIEKLHYKSGFSYGFGMYVNKAISNRTSFTAGADYHFLSAVSLVGNKNNITRTFYDLTLANSATVNEYYTAGRSVEYVNKYHFIELPLAVLIRLNKNEKRPFLITAGISPAYLLSSKALYANYNQNVYYADNTQFKKLQLTAQAGFQFSILNRNHFNILLGPEVQYGITNMGKPATQTNQHLFTTAIKANVSLH